MQEQALYGDQDAHSRSSSVEKLENGINRVGSWIWEAGEQALGVAKVKMVPVLPEYIRLPKPIQDIIDIKWGVGTYKDNYDLKYKILSDKKERTPGECVDRSREDGVQLCHLGATNEYIHPSVWRRYEYMIDPDTKKKLYKSEALNGFVRTKDPKYGSYGWKKGNLWIPEWFMKPTQTYLMEAGYDVGECKPHEEWENAEWAYTENVSDCTDLQPHIAKFYMAAMEAAEKMKADGKVFPFDIKFKGDQVI